MGRERGRETEVEPDVLAPTTRRAPPRGVALRGAVALAIVLPLGFAVGLQWMPRGRDVPSVGASEEAEGATDPAPLASSALSAAESRSSGEPSVEDEQRRTKAEESARIEGLAAAECREALHVHCGGRCPSYDEARARAMKAEVVPCARGGVEIGVCGPYGFVSRKGGYGGMTEYFDASGKMIGARAAADYAAFCEGRSTHVGYGAVPDCTERIERRICDEVQPRTACVPGDPLCPEPGP